MENMLYLFIGSTALSKAPGISAAGANPDVTPYTAPVDADLIRFGHSRVFKGIPVDPQGHPTPAIITRAAVLEAGIPVTAVQAGSWIAPSPPYVETGALPAGDPRLGPAVPDAAEIMESAAELARNAATGTWKRPFVMVAESVPGGTTTALLVLRALGYREMVSSAGPENPVNLKEAVWAEASRRLGIGIGGLADAPLRAISELGDPMQAAVTGFVTALPPETELVLAGGTQMLAVAALLRALGRRGGAPGKLPLVATTKYVQCDRNADFTALSRSIGVETWAAPLDFSNSPHRGLAGYENGYVKEGAGAGGSVYYAERLGVAAERVMERTKALYREMMNEKA
ncbi:MAG: TIGR00303 family protein [Spirochaetaceae bacterium]|nr:TIGR00303 family protein [Spirochaetaceae bacterium]